MSNKFIKIVIVAMAAIYVRGSFAAVWVEASRKDYRYRVGEEVVFTLYSSEDVTSGVMKVRLDNFGTNVLSEAKWELASNHVFKMSGRLGEPGFMRVMLSDERGVAWPAESVMVEPYKIRPACDEPGDFEAYWSAARAKLAADVPLDAKVEKVVARSTKEFNFYRISFATFGRRVYGFMSVPEDASAAKKYPVHFEVPGAGLGVWSQDMEGAADEIRVFMTVYDWPPMWDDLKGAKEKYDVMNRAAREKWGVGFYCQAGISEGRESYYYYSVLLGIDRVVDWVAARADVDLERFRYSGTSQGGTFGLYLAGLNKHFTRVVVYVPGADLLANVRAGRQAGCPYVVEAQKDARGKSAAEKWAPYFDAANFGRHIEVPIRFVCGSVDMVCAPASVWAAFNVCPSKDKDIEVGYKMGHDTRREFYERYEAWLRE